MRIFQFIILFFVTIVGFLLSGCSTTVSFGSPPQQSAKSHTTTAQSDERVNFDDPLLNSRKILLFGPIDQQSAEIAIQKLLFLDSKGHDPIDLFLETPGGDMKYAWAVLQTITLIHSPVNTYALSECNSGGAMLLAGGTGKRRAFHGAVIVIHGLKPGGGVMKPPAAFATDVQDSYTDFWRKCARLPQSWLPLPFDSLHILTAEQALKYGIVDEVIDKSKTEPPNKSPEPTAVGAVSSAVAVHVASRRWLSFFR
jgi:ATP-dependent Clp protease protease subunit